MGEAKRKAYLSISAALIDADPTRATSQHEVAFQELTELITRHAVGITPLQILAIAANIVGKLVAMQDQRTVSPELAMQVVAKNIELGNKQAFEKLMNSEGNA